MSAHKTRVPGALSEGGDIPPMGGKRTLRSIRKQSVPHILTIVADIEILGLCGSDQRLCGVVKRSMSPDGTAPITRLMTQSHCHKGVTSSAQPSQRTQSSHEGAARRT
jgi:hypothetical protein